MSNSILHEVTGGIARITLNRPEKRNALSLEMIEELSRVIGVVGADSSTRVVLLSARGEAFCSGLDLHALPPEDPDEVGRFAKGLADVYRGLLTLPIPLLCGLDGPAVGGGGGLALAADLVWVGPDALLAFPETRIGLVPALVSVVLRRRLSPLALSGILTTGVSCDAGRSVMMGLVDFQTPGSASAEADACAERLLSQNSGAAMRRTKEFLIAQSAADLDKELEAAEREFRKAVASPEAQRGLEAFRRKLSLAWGEATADAQTD